MKSRAVLRRNRILRVLALRVILKITSTPSKLIVN